MIFKPHDYQRAAIDFLLRNRCAGLFADPGLGKTAITLSVIKYFKNNPQFRGALIIAPLRVIYSVWPKEIRQWDEFKDLKFEILHGPKRQESVEKRADIYLLNAENIFWLFEYNFDWNMLVIDESSKFKSYSSKRFKAIKNQLNRFNRRIILTGTPAPNSLMDLYSQIYLLDKGDTLGRYITHYRQNYFYPIKYRQFIEWQLKPGADKLIHKKISKLIMRIDEKEYLDLPPVIYNKIFVKLPTQTMTIYNQIEKALFAQIDENPVLIGSSVKAYNACRQIANGCLYEPKNLLGLYSKVKNRKVFHLHDAKIKATKEIIDELQGKSVLIAYHYKHDLEQLLKFFGENTPYLGGDMNSEKSAKIIDQWDKGQIPILLGHPQSIAHGLNLQHGGHDIIWFSLTDNLENYKQFNKRIHRQGIKESVRIHLIIAENTIDEAIVLRLSQKDKSQQSLLDAIKAYRNEK